MQDFCFRSSVFTAALLVLLLGCGAPEPEAPTSVEPSQKNVLFIVLDDFNVALGTYAHSTAKTPNMDRLAAQGVRFDRAYSQDPVCNPSRSSFLSGRRPATTQVYGNFTGPRHVMGDVVMLPEHFAAQGYFTARVGKIAHGRYEGQVSWDISENAIRREHYLPGVDHATVHDNTWPEDAPRGLSREDAFAGTGRSGGLPLTWRATDELEEETPDGKTARRIVELLREHKDEPFFIAAGFHKPHQPWVAPASFFEQHPVEEIVWPHTPEDDLDDIPAPALGNYPDDKEHSRLQERQAIAAYHATVTLVDNQVGLLLDTLQELGLEESTIVMLVSDHGFHLGEHGGLWRKHTQFEESTRVPLIVRSPGHASGATTQGLVELVDLYPTLADLCDLPLPAGLEGKSFRPLLEDPSRSWKTAVFSGAQRHGFHGRTVRTTRHRYTEWTPLEGDGEVLLELYDLEVDPHEFKNLASLAEHLELRDDLARQLAADWQAVAPTAR